MSAVAVSFSAAFAEDVKLSCNDIDTKTVVGDYTETEMKEDNSGVKAYAHWQPLKSLALGDYTFTFADGGGKTAPSLYTTKTEGELQIRLYVSNSMTITAPEGKTFGKIVFETSNAKADYTCQASVGNCALSGTTLTWATETPVNTVTLTSGGTIRLLSMTISSEGGKVEGGNNGGTTTGGIHLETNNIDEASIVGTYVEEDLTGEIAVYGHWQPVESCAIGDWTFDFSYGAEDKNLPAVYKAKTPGQKSIRLYNGSSMTISAPADVKFKSIVMTLLNPVDSYTCTPSVGSYTYDAAAKTLTWTNTEEVTNVTFKSNGTIRIIAFDIDSNGQGGTTPDPGNYIYSNTLMGNDCGFTFDNVSGVEPWTIDAKYGLKASAFIDNAVNASDAYAVSPVFDLTNVEGSAVCEFEQAVNQFKANNEMIEISRLPEFVTVVTREENGEWETAECEFPASFSWNYAAAKVDLGKYAGKKCQIGFHYVSTSEVAGTWEIKNMKVSGTTAVSVIETEAGEAVYFDLQGRRVANPENGLYIRVQGNKATKVLVK